MKILNSNEAYAALMAGKNILCRAVGDLIDFDDLDLFPATVFAKADYEFCIKIETMELAGITFAKPLTPDEVQHGDDVYIVQASGEIHHYKYQVCHEALNQSVARGFAQRDPDNAQLQAQAFCELFDRVYREALIVEMDTQPKQKRNTGKKANNSTPAAANDASVPVEKKTLDKSDIQITEQGPVTTVKDTLSEDFIETDNGKDTVDQQAEPVHEHHELLSELLNDVTLAKTPVEVNALIRYTKSWSEDQRKPVIKAMNARLIELSKQNEEVTETPSLMVQIQNAPDLTALDVLEIDVGSRHPDIQPKLMSYVKKRRFELENGTGPVGAPL